MKAKIISVLVALTALAAGYIIGHPLTFGLCSTTYQTATYIGCLDSSIKSIGFPLMIFMLWIFPNVIIAVLFSDRIFRLWSRISQWFIPVLLIYIFTTPVNFTGIGLDLFPFYRDDAARLAGEVFTGVSLILLLWKYISERRNRALK